MPQSSLPSDVILESVGRLLGEAEVEARRRHEALTADLRREAAETDGNLAEVQRQAGEASAAVAALRDQLAALTTLASSEPAARAADIATVVAAVDDLRALATALQQRADGMVAAAKLAEVVATIDERIEFLKSDQSRAADVIDAIRQSVDDLDARVRQTGADVANVTEHWDALDTALRQHKSDVEAALAVRANAETVGILLAKLRDDTAQRMTEHGAALDAIQTAYADFRRSVDQRFAIVLGDVRRELEPHAAQVADLEQRFADWKVHSATLIQEAEAGFGDFQIANGIRIEANKEAIAKLTADLDKALASLRSDVAAEGVARDALDASVAARIDAAHGAIETARRWSADAVNELGERLTAAASALRAEVGNDIKAISASMAERLAALDGLTVEARSMLDAAVEDARRRVDDATSLAMRELRVDIDERLRVLRDAVRDGRDGEPGAPGPAGPEGPPGAPGADGRGFHVCGTYDPAMSYDANDVVVHKGGMWVATKDAAGELPGPDWQQVAQKGKPGERGAPGPAGARGAPGADAPRPVHSFFERRGQVTEYSDGTILVAEFPPWMVAAFAQFEVVE